MSILSFELSLPELVSEAANLTARTSLSQIFSLISNRTKTLKPFHTRSSRCIPAPTLSVFGITHYVQNPSLCTILRERTMKEKSLIVLLAMLLLAPPLSYAIPFTSVSAGFSVDCPVGMIEQPIQTINTAAGPATLRTFEGQDGRMAYFYVGIVQYQSLPIGQLPKDQMEGFMNAVAATVNGEVLLNIPAKVSGRDGRYMVIQATDQDGTKFNLMMKTVFVGTRMYFCETMATPGAYSGSVMTTFLDSFRLIGQ